MAIAMVRHSKRACPIPDLGYPSTMGRGGEY
ncbi:Uncharacterised protein [Vibrio cholerae]|nr:Uncharacterised protein [Vibrio cholerae]